jgi:hypothetical protein
MPSIRTLLEQNAPFGLRRLLTGHAVAIAAGLGLHQSGRVLFLSPASGWFGQHHHINGKYLHAYGKRCSATLKGQDDQ